jgi:hypothetical protein
VAVDEPLNHMTIFPEQGQVKDVAKLLLQLADHTNQVMTTLDPTIGFRIPWWLYELFVPIWDERTGREGAVADISPSEPEVAIESEVVVPVTRKPGRPRKEVK